MVGEYCPLSGLKVFTLSSWHNQQINNTITANYYLLGGTILYSKPCGIADDHAVQKTLAIRDDIAKTVSHKNKIYIEIEDYADLSSPSAAIRQTIKKKLVSNEHLKALIFCNLAPTLSAVLKIGMSNLKKDIKILVVRDYAEAITTAQELLREFGLFDELQKIKDAVLFHIERKSLSPHLLRHEDKWDIQTESFSNKLVIIDDRIAHSVAKGKIEKSDIPLIIEKRHAALTSLPADSSLAYFIVDATGLSGGNRTARKEYMESLKQWHDEHQIKRYIFYGVNRFLKTAARLAQPILPFAIHIRDDRDQAFRLIFHPNEESEIVSKRSERAQVITQESLENIIKFLGKIDWEQSDARIDVDISKDDPLYPVFEAIQLIKDEFFSLIGERNEALAALKKSNQQLAKALDELQAAQKKIITQERLTAVGQLAAGLAHDFNNILASISGYTELMQMSSEMPPSSKEPLAKIFDSAQRAATLVKQIMDFGQKSMLQPKRFALAEFLRQKIKALQRSLPENVFIEFSTGHEDFAIHADPEQIERVITNIVNNAVDAMPDGGSLSLHLRRIKTNGMIKCSVCAEAITGEWYCLSIADTGHGMTEKIIPKIFEPFFTTKDIGKGTGLGLSQVMGIIAQHRGHIRVDSNPGQGTTIYIYLPPIKEDDTGQDEEKTDLKVGHGETILLVEDEESVLETMAAMLEQLNYRVLRALNGEQAMQLFRDHREEIDLVISDYQLPDSNSEELLISMTSLRPSIKMILMSSYQIEERVDTTQGQFVEWFQKPISFKKLSQKTAKALAHKNGRWT